MANYVPKLETNKYKAIFFIFLTKKILLTNIKNIYIHQYLLELDIKLITIFVVNILLQQKIN